MEHRSHSWADFGAAQVVPLLSRDSPAAEDEAFKAAMRLGALKWCHENLLQPAARLSPHCHSADELPLLALLPAFSQERVCLADTISYSRMGDVVCGRVDGCRAVIKLADLQSNPLNAFEIANEVCSMPAQKELSLVAHQMQWAPLHGLC